MSDLNEDKVRAMIAQALKEHDQSAFPDGDVHGHRRGHELLIKDLRAKAKLREDMLNKIVTGGTWAAVVGIAYAVWVAIKSEVRK